MFGEAVSNSIFARLSGTGGPGRPALSTGSLIDPSVAGGYVGRPVGYLAVAGPTLTCCKPLLCDDTGKRTGAVRSASSLVALVFSDLGGGRGPPTCWLQYVTGAKWMSERKRNSSQGYVKFLSHITAVNYT